MTTISAEDRRALENSLKNEITEYRVYRLLASKEPDPERRGVLEKIADEERKHYQILSRVLGKDAQPVKWKMMFYTALSLLLGYSFALKHMENGEKRAYTLYQQYADSYPELKELIEDEKLHEQSLIELINEEKLEYVSSMILGLNDGVVELTGTVAGLSFALQDAKLVGITALVMGIAACLSMASSEYLSTKAEKEKNPLTAAFYTAVSYLLAVAVIIFPFFVFSSSYTALLVSIAMVMLAVAFFNYYVSVVQNSRFLSRWFEMTSVIVVVGLISFGVGILVRRIAGIDV